MNFNISRKYMICLQFVDNLCKLLMGVKCEARACIICECRDRVDVIYLSTLERKK